MTPPPAAGALRCLYVDLDGTLLGRRASLFHDGDGAVSMMGVKAVEACLRADVEICIYSGRRNAQVAEDARLIGQRSYIFEVGCGLVIDGELSYLTDDLQPSAEQTIFEQVAASGADGLLLERFSHALEYHSPWHLDREVSHLYRGLVDTGEANAVLAEAGFEHLRLVDNGRIGDRVTDLHVERMHAYHLIPSCAGKATAVAAHMRAKGYARHEVIAAGDSAEDIEVAAVVGRFYLMRNAIERNPDLAPRVAAAQNVVVTEEGFGAGVYEAVVGSLIGR